MSDKRLHPRASMPKTVYVVNKMTEEEYAQVVNISQSGMLLLGREKMTVGDVLQLELVISELNFKARIGVECVWAEPQKTNLTFGGFSIIDVNEKDLKLIQSLIFDSITD